ncbi:hypothetical protein FKP32DRAFT_953479 [Trametes sanguinea]|nr:hypothetical protein FKP32DRAFT_953479 [Trametes sanguinea]
MAKTDKPTAANDGHGSQRLPHSQGMSSAHAQSGSSMASASQPMHTPAQRVLVQYRTHIWIPGTIVSGPVYSTLFQSQAFEIEFFEVDGTRARRFFLARDVRPAPSH